MTRSHSIRRVAALAIGAFGLAFAASVPAQNVRIPGTNVTIAPPPGFAVTRVARTLEHSENGSTISFQEMSPAAYPDLAEIFSSPRTASQRFRNENTRIMRIEPVDVNGKQVPLAIGDQTVGRRTVTKYLALLGDPADGGNIVLVTFNLTDPRALSRKDVEAAIRSISFGRVPTADDLLARLPFTFKEAPPYRIQNVTPTGSVMLRSLAESGAAAQPPTMLIERANTTSAPSETVQFAETLLRNAVRADSFDVMERATVPFAGGDGLFLAAAAGDVAVLQFVRVLAGGRYILLAAWGEKEALLATRSGVEAIASSLELK